MNFMLVNEIVHLPKGEPDEKGNVEFDRILHPLRVRLDQVVEYSPALNSDIAMTHLVTFQRQMFISETAEQLDVYLYHDGNIPEEPA